VHLRADLHTELSAAQLFPWLEDLGRYPAWLDIVREAVPLEADEEGPAWEVVLEARVGPFRRGKRLRMVRTAREPDRSATFERRERDGRDHAAWLLAAELEPGRGGSGAAVVMDLRYEGGLWGAAVEAVLARAIEDAKPALVACAAGAVR
jgi:hypothetical protein